MSDRAERDIADVQNWILARSPEGAERWLTALDAALFRLAHSAAECPRADEADRFGIDLRQQTFRTRRGLTYRLVFPIHADVVRVAALRGAGQDWLRADEIELE